MIITPNMLKTISISKDAFIKKYIEKIPTIQLSEPFMKGKEIHALANYYLKGQNISKLEKALNKNQLQIWTKLKTNEYFNLEVINSEYFISAKLKTFWIGGRIDALVKKENNYYILDYKTGQIPKNSTYDYQTMVYLYCMDKILKYYETLNFIYIGLKENSVEKITLTKELNEEYITKIHNACTQIKSLM
jgi:ATP-dependent exoDNAse (exonuclease V) beta subunit